MKIHWKHLSLTLIIGWFLGAASGLLIMRLYHNQLPHLKHSEKARDHFFKELNLTPDQKMKATAILQTGRQTLDGIFSETQSRVDTVRDITRAQIRQLLTPDQQVTFDKIHAKWEIKHKKRQEDFKDRF